MEVILLEKIEKVGALGEVVKVKPGFGRNFLVPQGKALPATKGNRARFDAERAAHEQRQVELKAAAEALAAQVEGVQVVLQRPAGNADKLFGSVTNADIAEFLKTKGVDLPRRLIEITRPIKVLGEHSARLMLHPDVTPILTVRVERAAK